MFATFRWIALIGASVFLITSSTHCRASDQSTSVKADYAVIRMSIEVNRSAEATWAKVGRFCDLGVWMKIDCTITSGGGEIGSVRSIAGGRVIEIMVAKTPLSYGYAQPPASGRPYDLYHGFLEARPISPTRSELLYTLVYDASVSGSPAGRDADIARRRALFEGALKSMKSIAESGD